MRVVDHLYVERLSTLFQEQSRQRVPLRVRWPVLFAFPDDAHERRVAAVTGHEIRVRIGASIEQRPSDGHRIVADRGDGKSGETEIQERLPSFRAQILEKILTSADTCPVGADTGILFQCRFGLP